MQTSVTSIFCICICMCRRACAAEPGCAVPHDGAGNRCGRCGIFARRPSLLHSAPDTARVDGRVKPAEGDGGCGCSPRRALAALLAACGTPHRRAARRAAAGLTLASMLARNLTPAVVLEGLAWLLLVLVWVSLGAAAVTGALQQLKLAVVDPERSGGAGGACASRATCAWSALKAAGVHDGDVRQRAHVGRPAHGAPRGITRLASACS